MATGKKTKRVIEAEGVAHVSATFNNTTITITDQHGNAISWGSSGKAGWKNAKQRMEEGIPVGPGLMQQVRQIAQASAAPWLLD